MSDHEPKDPGKLKRLKRLEEQLKANLRRRKTQARARIEDTTRSMPQAPDDASAKAVRSDEKDVGSGVDFRDREP